MLVLQVGTKITFITFIIFLTCTASCNRSRESSLRVFRYNQPEGISTLDPAYTRSQPMIWAAHQLYNTLVDIDDSLRFVPALAKRWEISDDGLTYTFYLRRDVFFHDNPAFTKGRGRLMKADDVVYSLGRIINKAVASPGAWIFNGKVDTVQPFTALNDSTFQLKLLRPFPPIVGILSMKYCSIVPKEVVQLYGKDFRRNPCGTGPFFMKSWEEGQALILHRNEKYFERDSEGKQLPYLDAVKISFLDNKATEFMEFQQGRLDFVNDIEASFKDEVLTKLGDLKKEWNGKIVLNKHPYLNTEYLGIMFDSTNQMLASSPLREKKIRQAMNHAIDREKMMMYLRNSIGTPAESGFVPAGFPSFNATIVKGYGYDPEKARRLLKEAGYNESADVITLKTIPIYAELGAFVARQLEDVGMRVKVETIQRATLLEETSKGTALFWRANWSADYPDAENYLGVFYSKNPAPPNYTRYKNAAFDKLYEQALTENNDSVRYDMYRKMDQLVMYDAPVIPLWYDMAIHLVNPKVKGFKPNALNQLELRRAFFR
jgi:oligopeptide transport system substrate-binding protein